jgi:hypothetical protein
MGAVEETNSMIEKGQISRVIDSYALPRSATKGKDNLLEQKVREKAIELEVYPMGTLTEKYRAGGAGIAAFLAEVSATTADPDDRADLLRQLAASIGVGDPNWTGRLVEEAAEPSADLTADVLALAAYLDRQGSDSGLTEALARKLPDSPIT